MKSSILRFAVIGILVLNLFEGMPPVFADEISAEEVLTGDYFGVQNLKRGDHNQIKSLWIIGRAPINRALPKAKAKISAYRVADANARSELVKFFKTDVKYSLNSTNDVVEVIHGFAAGDEGEAGSKTETHTYDEMAEKTGLTAEGFVSGLSQIGLSTTEDGEAVVILKWSAANLRAVESIENQQTAVEVNHAANEKKVEDAKKVLSRSAQDSSNSQKLGKGVGSNSPVGIKMSFHDDDDDE